MKIKNHLLFNDNDSQVSYKPTPNKAGRYVPQYLVMHYTAATTTESCINWFVNTHAQASAHLVIGRDGAVTQFAPFNIVTWHAGKSQWKGQVGMNQFAIGIELVNAGRLIKSGDKWVCPVDMQRVSDKEVILAIHKNETKQSAWQEYTNVQMEVSIEIASLLVKTYGLLDVVGHEDISPIRKSDPGPAFPMSSFRSKAMGRRNEHTDEFSVSVDLNIRTGPGTENTVLTTLPINTPVLILKTEGTWSFVEVLNTVNGIMDLEGWVSSKFLSKM